MNEKVIISGKPFPIFGIILVIIGIIFGISLLKYVGLSAMLNIATIVGVISIILTLNAGITVTDKRVFGKAHSAFFWKRCDLPIDSISSVSLTMGKSISVSTSSGIIKFGFILNADEIYSEINALLINRQQNSQQKPEISKADEILKYKELLNAGVITEEQFEEKKNELLNC